MITRVICKDVCTVKLQCADVFFIGQKDFIKVTRCFLNKKYNPTMQAPCRGGVAPMFWANLYLFVATSHYLRLALYLTSL